MIESVVVNRTGIVGRELGESGHRGLLIAARLAIGRQSIERPPPIFGRHESAVTGIFPYGEFRAGRAPCINDLFVAALECRPATLKRWRIRASTTVSAMALFLKTT